MKKPIVLLIILIIGLFLISCDSKEDKFERILTVASEVDYGYVAYDNNEVIINFERYNLEEEVDKIKKIKGGYINPYSQYYTDKYVYYLYQYDSHGGIKYDKDNISYNRYTFDVGLFKIDLYTGECSLLYDFKEVYPIYRYSYTYPLIYSNLINDEYLRFTYNGKLEIFDLKKEEIVYSKDLYQKDLYIDRESFPYGSTAYGDYYYFKDNILNYYKYEIDKYVLHKFYAYDNINVSRVGDLIFLYTSGVKFNHAYSLLTDEVVNIDEAMIYRNEILDQIREQDKDPYSFNVNNQIYYFEIYGDGIGIFNNNQEKLIKIDVDFMKQRSETYNKLAKLWLKNDEVYAIPESIRIVDDRIFITCRIEYRWSQATPLYIFEYDMVKDEVYYVGFHTRYAIQGLKIIEK